VRGCSHGAQSPVRGIGASVSARSWVIPYVGLAAIWGCSFAFNKTALTGLTPVQLTTVRMSLGAVTLLVFLALTRAIPRPSRAEWRHLAIVGILGLALPFLLIAFAQTRVTSILAGLLNAATPLFAGLFISLLIPSERPDRLQVIGLLVGFLGIGVLVGVWNLPGDSGVDPVGVAAMIGATACYGFSTSFSRVSLSSSDMSGAQLSAIQLACGAAMCVLVLPADPGDAPGPLTGAAIASVLALGVLGTGVAMVLFWGIIRRAGSTIAATVTYVVPVVSTTVGVLLLSEELHVNQVVGGVIVIVGVLLTQRDQMLGSSSLPDEEPAERTNE
jgi:drug/metabolite transporter (DMT)-like permease